MCACIHVYVFKMVLFEIASQIFKIAAEKLKSTADFLIVQFYSILLKGIDSKI